MLELCTMCTALLHYALCQRINVQFNTFKNEILSGQGESDGRNDRQQENRQMNRVHNNNNPHLMEG